MKCLHSRLTSAFTFSDATVGGDHLYGSNHNAISFTVMSALSTTSCHSLKEDVLPHVITYRVVPVKCHHVSWRRWGRWGRCTDQTILNTPVWGPGLHVRFAFSLPVLWFHSNDADVFCLSVLQRVTPGEEEKVLEASCEAAVTAERSTDCETR